MENEIWRPVVKFEGLYEVSNLGRVRSLNRYEKCGNIFRIRRGKILKPYLTPYGYHTVNLYREGKARPFFIHRLVAEAFIPNPNNYPIINHKSEKKIENTVSNLEWCSYAYNNAYNGKQEKIAKKRINGVMSKKVLQFSKNKNFIKEWPSISEIQRSLGLAKQNISACCLGKVKTCGGYVWRYAS